MKKSEKIDRKLKNPEKTELGELIRRQIISKYGKLKNFAKDANMLSSTLSEHLNNPTDQFIHQVEQKGINVRGRINEIKGMGSTTIKTDEALSDALSTITSLTKMLTECQIKIKELEGKVGKS